MQSKHTLSAEELLLNQDDYAQTPFDGFVNVNDIIKRRRQLRTAEFSVLEQSWDVTSDLPAVELAD
jgi:hypothetical protein